MELTKEQKIAALKHSLNILLQQKGQVPYFNWGICNDVSLFIDGIVDRETELKELNVFIPELQRPKETLSYESHYWWPLTDFDSRIQYLENLIKQIENQA